MKDSEKELTYVKEAFANGAKAVTMINGKPAPWTPFGMEANLGIFRSKKEREEKLSEKPEEEDK